MSAPVFSIEVDDKQYSLVLPNCETDYIQGLLAEKSIPYELAMLRAMGSLLRDGDLVLDVGANIGNHSIYLAMVVGCRVVAFEPNPSLASPFKKSIEINGLEHLVSVVEKGLGAAAARVVFSESKPDNLGAQSLQEIDDTYKFAQDEVVMEVVRIDSMSLDGKVKAIKIDVEGMELEVLEGAIRLLEVDRPSLFIESHTEEQFVIIHDFLAKWGYVYWGTFNATPTNWFLPSDLVMLSDHQQHGLEQAKAFYKLWEERQRLRKMFLDLQKKQQVNSERLVAFEKKLEHGSSKAFDDCITELAHHRPTFGDTNGELPCPRLGFFDDAQELERNLGLDFDLPEDVQGKGLGLR